MAEVMMAERLQKLLANAGYGSRRKCESLIAAGRVSVNGKMAQLGQKADIKDDIIKVDGNQIAIENLIYIKLFKPKGVLSSTTDELNQGRPTVTDLIPVSGHLFPVGRLDKQSEGLILLTNDGLLTHRLTHPRYQHEKIYEVIVDGDVPSEIINQWQEGVVLDGRRTATSIVEVEEKRITTTKLRVTLREGKKRQIRRIAAAFGFPVRRLTRIQIGTLKLGNLKSGEWRYLTSSELVALQESVRDQ